MGGKPEEFTSRTRERGILSKLSVKYRKQGKLNKMRSNGLAHVKPGEMSY